MKITKVEVFQKNYTMAAGKFVISGGKVATSQDSTIVRIETDEGLIGWGEHCVFSPGYMVAHGEGARAALTLLGPAVIGLDPTIPEMVYQVMEKTMKGHHYAKGAIDIACWDIFGKRTKMSVSDLLGGTHRTQIPLYAPISMATPDEMQADCEKWKSRGYKRFQLKVGGDYETDLARMEQCLGVIEGADRIIFDANGNWTQHEAIQIVAALGNQKVYIEQPCATIQECARVRERSHFPFILDESLLSASDILEGHQEKAMDAVMLKISRFGGITPVKRARDLSMTLGLSLTIEDSGGSDIITAAMAHLSASTPERFFLNGFFTGTMVKEKVSEWACSNTNGLGELPQGPGLGIEVIESEVGKLVASYT
ncbi:MAG: mandelate racemase/muconate lactonizing enzyme family protein [Candidatus Nanopelagicaceae bacterium]